MKTVTLFTVTSRVWPVERSMFFNRIYFDRLFLLFDILLEDFEPCGLLEPGNWIWVAACWATSAEFIRGFRVEVPKKITRKNLLKIVVACYLNFESPRHGSSSYWLLFFAQHQYIQRIFSVFSWNFNRLFGVFQVKISNGIFATLHSRLRHVIEPKTRRVIWKQLAITFAYITH